MYLNLYRSSDVMLIESIPLPTEIKVLNHAVQLSNGNFIISHSMNDDPDVFLISELSVDGRKFIRSFDPRSFASIGLDGWTPIIYRSMKMETYSSLTTITTELFCCILDGLMFKYS